MVTGAARAKRPSIAPSQRALDYGIVFPVLRVAKPLEAKFDALWTSDNQN